MKKNKFFKIQYIGLNETVVFASAELGHYLRLMESGMEIAFAHQERYNPSAADTIWIGRDTAFEEKLPYVKDLALDDGIYINVGNEGGVITGTNDRSVLLGVYRFLRELGYAWLFPGKMGERIPRAFPDVLDIRICEAASCRHRGVCIEGAVSYGHVFNMIEWLPRVGMNSFFNQFVLPFTFFERWYTHEGNPHLNPVSVSKDDVAGMVRDHVTEIKKRGMLYHAVGHSWTCEPFGIEGNSWNKKDYQVPEESLPFLAQVNGKRGLWDGVPLNTNLCYGNPEVRDRVTSAIVSYCRQNPFVDYVQFWLADAYNNHCECDRCKDTEPADFYVMMLNRLDEKLSAAGLKTRIVFLLYQELLWSPRHECIQNPGRFVLLFAPISRTYSRAYTDDAIDVHAELDPYKRNKITLPRDVSVNIAALRKWQQHIPDCDSLLFDYHYMWDHFKDPGYMDIARVMFRDMQNLDKLVLNGMLSCQTLRAFFPTGLGMVLMAEALWNKDSDYNASVDRYFSAAYGDDGHAVLNYLNTLSSLFDPPYIRHEKSQVDPQKVKDYDAIETLLNTFASTIAANATEEKNREPWVRYSWNLLAVHAECCRILARSFKKKASGDQGEAEKLFKEAAEFIRSREMELHDVLDVYLFVSTMNRAVCGMDATFI
jgi:hypothetical protein